MESIQTNLAVSEEFWRSATDIETCIEVKKQCYKKLISIKNNEELMKLRNKAQLSILNANIEISMEP